MRVKVKSWVAPAATLMVGVALRGARNNSPSYEWAPAGNLTTSRVGACAAVLPDNTVLIVGGEGPQGASTAVDIYSPSGRISAAPATLSAHAGHACATLADGRVLVAGGGTGGAATNAAETYDPRTRTWSSVKPLLTARKGATASVLSTGRVLIAGGENAATPLAT